MRNNLYTTFKNKFSMLYFFMISGLRNDGNKNTSNYFSDANMRENSSILIYVRCHMTSLNTIFMPFTIFYERQITLLQFRSRHGIPLTVIV